MYLCYSNYSCVHNNPTFILQEHGKFSPIHLYFYPLPYYRVFDQFAHSLLIYPSPYYAKINTNHCQLVIVTHFIVTIVTHNEYIKYVLYTYKQKWKRKTSR